MNIPDLTLVAAAVFAFALISRRAEAGVVTAPMAFVVFGLLVSPAALDVVAIPYHTAFINDLAELTLVLTLFTDAARIDLRRLNAQHSLALRLLGLGLPLTMAAGAGAALLLFADMNLWQACLLGAILAPTDAALGQAVVTNERVPLRIRQALNVESGINDGLAFPALLVFMSLVGVAEETRGFGDWLVFIAKQLVLGPAAGVVVGLVGGTLVEIAVQRRWMNHVFVQISVLSLALLAFGGADLIGGNGFMAAFCAGLSVATRSKALLQSVEDFGETEGQLLALIVFLLFGATMASRAVADVGWLDVLYAVLSLTVVRMVPVALSLIGSRLQSSTVVFLGWFGPRGLASILYLLLIVEAGDTEATGDLFTTVVTTVFLSVLLHGVSASPAAQAYGAHMARLVKREGAGVEHRPVFPFPTRFRWRAPFHPERVGRTASKQAEGKGT